MVCDRYTATPDTDRPRSARLCKGSIALKYLSSLYWAAPSLPEPYIVEAFNLATETWPYGGVTNKEFAIALKYLKVSNFYSTDINKLGDLLADNASARAAACLQESTWPSSGGMGALRPAF